MRSRPFVLVFLFAFVLAGAAGRRPSAAAVDVHGNAVAALADVRATVGEIAHIEDGFAVGHAAYVRAAHRALNALVGRRDDGYVASFGDSGDGVGALGHIDALLDTEGTSLWTPAMQGAKANVLAAAENLQTATHEREMEEYQADLTHALANLALVAGRASQSGVFGGLSGALANTSLAVPRGAASVSGCALPARAPAYGVVSGRLVYVALPRAAAATKLPGEIDVSRVVIRGDEVVLYTAAAAEAAALCGHASTGRSPARRTTAQHAAPRRSPARRERTGHVASVAHSAGLYTMPQAQAGAEVYRRYCIACHGVDLQGTAGPGVAGTEFLTTARANRWHLSDLRTTVVENMPFSNPGSLTPTQYADVLAFLLASNCYPAGAVPFPTTQRPQFAAIALATSAATVRPKSRTGTCAVASK
jgi:hypothetical protein